MVRRTPLLTVDVVVKTEDGVVLVRRAREPYKGKWALPGGFVRYGEMVERAAVREALEETGLKVKPLKLVGVYSALGRDPRGHVVSVCFAAKPVGGKLKTGKEVEEARAFKRVPWRELAFDHAEILKDAIRVMR